LSGLSICHAHPNFFVNNSLGVRTAYDGLVNNDGYSAVARLGMGMLWHNGSGYSMGDVDKYGLELAVNTGFSGRENTQPSPSGSNYFPLDLNFSESLDVLGKYIYDTKCLNYFVQAGVNTSVMKPLNASGTVHSKFRFAPKIVLGLEKNVNKNWFVNAAVSHIFNVQGHPPKTGATVPFKLTGNVHQTLLTVGAEYRTNFA